MTTVEEVNSFGGVMAEEEFLGIHLPRRYNIPDDHTPERVARLARRYGMRYTYNDHPCGVRDDGYVSGLKEREIYIPHRTPIDKSDACCKKLNVT
jgi:hypothetical protein